MTKFRMEKLIIWNMICANISCKIIVNEESNSANFLTKQKSFPANGSMLLEYAIKGRSVDFLIVFLMKRKYKNLCWKMKISLKKNLKEMVKRILESIMWISGKSKQIKSSNRKIRNHWWFLLLLKSIILKYWTNQLFWYKKTISRFSQQHN